MKDIFKIIVINFLMFSTFDTCMYLREGRLIACDAINAPRDFMQSKALIASRCAPDKTLLADAGIQLKDLADG